MEFSDGYSRSVATKKLWYLGTNNAAEANNTGFDARRALTQAVNDNGTGGSKTVNTTIPLNRYSFFEELEDKMLVPMHLELNIQLQDDNELVYRANGVDGDALARVVVTKFQLWVPKLTPKTPCMINMFHHSRNKKDGNILEKCILNLLHKVIRIFQNFKQYR